MKKKLFSMLIALVMLISIAPAVFAEEAEDEDVQEVQDEAYLMYADASWTYQYWSGDPDGGVVATNATVTGPGDYTVGLDFTGTADGQASGLAFAAVGIVTGEQTFPGDFIEITSIKVNGEEIDVGKGYTSSDDAVTTRMNIFNEWVEELPADARSVDGDISDASPIIVDTADFEAVETVEVDFTLHEGLGDYAYLMYADADWMYQYWSGAPENGIKAQNASVLGAGEYTVGLDFTETETGVAAGLAFTAVGIVTGEETFPGYFIDITSIKVNGEEIDYDKGYTSSDDGVEMRMNIYNEWVEELPDDARSADGDISDASPIIVDKELFAEVETVEVTFDFISGDPADVDDDEDDVVAIDVDEALAAEYNAYFGVQTTSYIFRNAWNEPSYGMETDNWSRLTGWDEEGEQVNYGGSFTDAAITGNGTYTVSCELGEMGFGDDEAFRMLFVSTDIPGVLLEEGHITISDVSTVIDGGRAQEYTYAAAEGDYVMIMVINEYNADVGTETIGYMMPTEQIDITFTIDGLAQDAAVDDGDEEPVDEGETDEDAGLEGWVWAVIIGGSLAVVAAIIIIATVVSKKKKA